MRSRELHYLDHPLFGVIALFRLPVQLTPNVDDPVIYVRTAWPGASPVEVERQIVQEQEEQLKSVEGLIKMESESRDSRGEVTRLMQQNLRGELTAA